MRSSFDFVPALNQSALTVMWATGQDGQLKLALTLTAAFVALAAPAHAQDFPCTVASITDGDTFRCTDGKKIRIHGIDALEMDTQ